MSRKPKWFAAIPARIFRDDRVTGAHFKLLGQIAMHDRMDHNGTGCTASRARLAYLLGWQQTNVSHTLADLRAYGYVASSAHPTDPRRLVHRVLYTDEDRAWARPPDGCVPAHLNRCVPEHLSGADRCNRLTGIGVKFSGKNAATPSSDSGNSAEAYASKHIRIEGATDEADGAETRRRKRLLPVEDPDEYLTKVEALDDEDLPAERQALEALVASPLVTDEQRERAAILLEQSGRSR